MRTLPLPIAPHSYVHCTAACPYLEGRMERKLFTALQKGDVCDQAENNRSVGGKESGRSQNVLYRPSCAALRTPCYVARISHVGRLQPEQGQKAHDQTHRRDSRRANVAMGHRRTIYDSVRPPHLDSRHVRDGAWDMTMFSEFAAMIEETPIRSRVIGIS